MWEGQVHSGAAQELLLSQRLSHVSQAKVVAQLAQNGGSTQQLGQLKLSHWQHYLRHLPN